jgi:hypothetical protein
MARVNTVIDPARRSGKTSRKRSRGGEDWVWKNVVVDQRKLDAPRRVLGVETETEAIDVALDLVTFRREFVRGFSAFRRAGGIDDVFEKPPALIANDRSVVS